MPIHQTAIVDRNAEIDPSADIGPYVVIEGEVQIGPGTKVYAGAYLTGWTTIGANCEIHPHAVIGHLPQDLHFDGAKSYCRIGDGTVIREHVTVHRGTQPESETILGKNCFLLAGSHVAHNCVLEDQVTLINAAQIGGHVTIGRRAVISSGTAVHQFCRIGEMAMLSGDSSFSVDVPPYMTACFRNAAVGINTIGMQRGGATSEEIAEIREAYKILFLRGKLFRAAIEEVEQKVTTDYGRKLVEFLKQPSKKGYLRARGRQSE